MRTLTVNASGEYEILIAQKPFEGMKLPDGRVVLITDENVYGLYAVSIKRYLGEKLLCEYVVSSGETSKSGRFYLEIMNFLAEKGVQRTDAVLAFGGGVVGDLAGFVASTYMRGLPWIGVPTSLLAMVDSSVGGKTAINLDYGKNLCGTFYQPNAVYIYTDFLLSLPEREKVCGLGEILKYSFLSDRVRYTEQVDEELIYRCLQVKAAFVDEDEKDNGKRKLLNFGHTFGHAIEKASGFSLSHGLCVAKGIEYSLRFSAYYYGWDETLTERITKRKELFSARLPELPTEEWIKNIRNDKKAEGDRIDFILYNGKEVTVENIPWITVERWLKGDCCGQTVRASGGAPRGTVVPPPSKSVAHRMSIMSGFSGKRYIVEDVGNSDDIEATVRAMRAMGVEVETEKSGTKTTLRVLGRHQPKTTAIADCGESGSTLRFLLPTAAMLGIETKFIGSERLFLRPLTPMVQLLRENGVTVEERTVRGRMKGNAYRVDGSQSSQFVSGLITGAVCDGRDCDIVIENGAVSRPYIELTADIARRVFGQEITFDGKTVSVRHRPFPADGKRLSVEKDASAAAVWAVSAAIGGEITVDDVPETSRQGDWRIFDVMKEYGAIVIKEKDSVKVISGTRTCITKDCSDIPDLVPILAVGAAFAVGQSVFSGVGRLRGKESDRLSAISNLLRAAGIRTECTSDTLYVDGGQPHAGVFFAENDHRIAMAAAILASHCEGESVIHGADAVKKSYPEFWEHFSSLGGRYVRLER